MKLKIATGSVRVWSPDSTSENMKLFHEKMKAMIDAVMMPGTASGSAMRMNTPKIEEPSMRAASSNSFGRLSKKGIMIHAMNGKPTTMWLRISGQYESVSPRRLNTMYHAIMKIMPGTIRAVSSSTPTPVLRSPAIPYAAGSPSTSDSSVDAAATTNVLTRYKR